MDCSSLTRLSPILIPGIQGRTRSCLRLLVQDQALGRQVREPSRSAFVAVAGGRCPFALTGRKGGHLMVGSWRGMRARRRVRWVPFDRSGRFLWHPAPPSLRPKPRNWRAHDSCKDNPARARQSRGAPAPRQLRCTASLTRTRVGRRRIRLVALRMQAFVVPRRR